MLNSSLQVFVTRCSRCSLPEQSTFPLLSPLSVPYVVWLTVPRCGSVLGVHSQALPRGRPCGRWEWQSDRGSGPAPYWSDPATPEARTPGCRHRGRLWSRLAVSVRWTHNINGNICTLFSHKRYFRTETHIQMCTLWAEGVVVELIKLDDLDIKVLNVMHTRLPCCCFDVVSLLFAAQSAVNF